MSIEVRESQPYEIPKAAPAAEAPKSEQAPEKAVERNESAKSDPAETEESDDTDEAEEYGSEDEQAAKDPEKEAESDKPRKEGGFQKRIRKLNTRVQTAQQEAEYWRNQALKNAPSDQTQARKPEDKAEPAGKPKAEDFESYVAYTEALTDWKVDQRLKADKEEARKSEIKTEHEKSLKAHHAREKDFAEKTDDYAEVIEEANYLKGSSAAVAEAIITSENGPALMYELAKNPEDLKRINALPPLAAARELGRIEFSIASGGKKDPEPELKKPSSAPKPIAPVGGAGKAVVAKSIDDPNLSQAEYERLRKEQMKRKRA